MYFVWRSNAALAKKFMYVGTAPPGFDQLEWISGKPLSKQPPLMTLIGKEESPPMPSDVVLGGFNVPVFSPRAIAVLEQTGVDNVQYFPINIKNWENGLLDTSYKIANILGLVNCLDKEHATFNTFPDNENEISWLQQYRIFEDRIPRTGSKKTLPLVFRLGEYRYHVLAHESVKVAFEKEGLTGSKFVPPEKFA